MSVAPDVIVIGGGIWGLSTAFHLAKRGICRVRLLERNFDVAQETTINAAGQVGQIRSSPVVTRAIAYALDLFESFPSQFGHDPGLYRCGSLFIGLNGERLSYFQKQIARGLANGLQIDQVSRTAMASLVPGLAVDRIDGGYFVHGDGYLDSVKAARALAGAASDLNADIRLGIRVTGIRMQAGRAAGVETTVGFMPAGAVVVAAGPWTSAVAKQLGIELPAQPIRHQRVKTLPYAGLVPHHPVLRVPDLSCYVRPDGGSLIYGHFEREPDAFEVEAVSPTFHTSDLDPPVDVMSRAKLELSAIYPAIGELEVAEYRRGLITFAPDGGYVLGPIPQATNLYFATGCAALGIAGSAAVGKWIAEWILDGAPVEDVSEFSPNRFGTMSPLELKQKAREAYSSYYAIQR
ncbi:FAD-binding oxidoreductase [bacterium]|nr:FAD-binding oxidoreductase [bacterium]